MCMASWRSLHGLYRIYVTLFTKPFKRFRKSKLRVNTVHCSDHLSISTEPAQPCLEKRPICMMTDLMPLEFGMGLQPFLTSDTCSPITARAPNMTLGNGDFSILDNVRDSHLWLQPDN